MKNNEKEFKKKRFFTDLVIVLLVFFVTAIIAGGGMWLFQNEQLRSQKAEYESQIATLENRAKSSVTTTTTSKPTDTASDWQKYQNSKNHYQIDYPNAWVYKDYELSEDGGPVVTFAPSLAQLPPERSDAPGIINTRMMTEDLSDSITTDPTKIQKETITIKDKTVKKWTLSAGRETDLFGDRVLVYVSFPLDDKFVYVELMDVEYKDVFDSMVTTFTAL